MKKILKLIKLTFAYLLREVQLLEVFILIRDYLNFLIWQIAYEPNFLGLIRQKITKFDYTPLISIVLPVYNPPKKALKDAIRSVLKQTYKNWELCIVDSSTNVDISELLRKISQRDKRIKVEFSRENHGIAGNTNKAIIMSEGEYIAFLDHDDELSKFALFEVVSLLNVTQNIDLIYSDEDLKTDHFYIKKASIIKNLFSLICSNKRFSPIFKPDFSIDLLRSCNYITHLVVVKKEIGDKVGWLRENFEGAQDYDFLLRITEVSNKIIHIPKILYHWRRVSTSTARSIDAKPYAHNSGKKALEQHLARQNLPAIVSDGFIPTWYRVNYILKKNVLVTIVIPNSNNSEELTRCVGSILLRSSYTNFEILVIDNNSDADVEFYYNKIKDMDDRIRILRWEKPFNFHSLNNWATSFAEGDVILFLNNDIEVISKDWLEQMISICIRHDVGFVGAKLLYPNKTIQHAGITIGKGGVAGHDFLYFPHDSPGYFGRLVQIRNVSAVTGACMMTKKQVFCELGGFDENYTLSYGDVDICLRALTKGYLNVWTPYALLYHYESKTRGYEDTPEKQLRFLREKQYFLKKWHDMIEKGDPYYNRNLSYKHSDYRIKILK